MLKGWKAVSLRLTSGSGLNDTSRTMPGTALTRRIRSALFRTYHSESLCPANCGATTSTYDDHSACDCFNFQHTLDMARARLHLKQQQVATSCRCRERVAATREGKRSDGRTIRRRRKTALIQPAVHQIIQPYLRSRTASISLRTEHLRRSVHATGWTAPVMLLQPRPADHRC